MLVLVGAVIGIGLALWLLLWALRPTRTTGPNACPTCKHDTFQHLMNVGATRCECCRAGRKMMKKSR